MVDAKQAQDAQFWGAVYAGRDAYSRVIQLRHATAQAWVKDLPLRRGAAALEVGCGAGRLSMALARSGLTVSAIDRNPHMAGVARAQALGQGGGPSVLCGDAHGLPFRDGTFELVVALGVLGWLQQPAQALTEISRVMASGGYLLLSAANRWGLAQMFDPFQNPFLAGPATSLLCAARAVLDARKREQPLDDEPGKSHSAAEVAMLLRKAGFKVRRQAGLGFGPFGIRGRPVLPERVALRLQQRLQRLADDGWPASQALGTQLLFLAQKPGPSA
jgi:ubiquinone/menaquinone biosynthesis C-methylase UbiE